MLIEFSVGNFRSFKEQVTFSMVAANIKAKDKEIDERNVFDAKPDLQLLKTAAIYGANASGKTNVARAFQFMRRLVLNSSKESQATEPIAVEPFALAEETLTQPSTFELVFLVDGKQYRYGFEVDAKQVVAEWLFHVPRRREARLFERNYQEITIASAFKEGQGLENRTRNNALFLSVVAQFNGEIATAILQWFNDLDVRLGISDIDERRFTTRILEQDIYKNEIIQLIRQLDLGINDILLEQRAVPLPPPPQNMSESSYRNLLHSLDLPKRTVVTTIHRVYDAEVQPIVSGAFELDTHESEGTKKLFGLAGFLTHTLATGQVLVVDELDARLHPLITEAIIDLFNSKETNPHNAQLIFTTHDTNLLSNKRFRRDQIWFTEKDRYGVTHLYSLAEYKVRNDASYEKDYIQGRYGAIPYLGDFHSLLEDVDA